MVHGLMDADCGYGCSLASEARPMRKKRVKVDLLKHGPITSGTLKFGP